MHTPVMKALLLHPCASHGGPTEAGHLGHVSGTGAAAQKGQKVHVYPRHSASSPGQGRLVTVTAVHPLASCIRDGDAQLAVPRIPVQSHLPVASVAPDNWGSAPGMGKDQILWRSRQVPPFRKSNGPHTQVTAGTALPSCSWKADLCSAPDTGLTAEEVSILTAASCWLPPEWQGVLPAG